MHVKSVHWQIDVLLSGAKTLQSNDIFSCLNFPLGKKS